MARKYVFETEMPAPHDPREMDYVNLRGPAQQEILTLIRFERWRAENPNDPEIAETAARRILELQEAIYRPADRTNVSHQTVDGAVNWAREQTSAAYRNFLNPIVISIFRARPRAKLP